MLLVAHKSGLLYMRYTINEHKDSQFLTINNLTILNLCLYWWGPMKEKDIVKKILGMQAAWCAIALIIRHPIAQFFYNY